MYSLNAELPPGFDAQLQRIQQSLPDWTLRDSPSLVVKRLDVTPPPLDFGGLRSTLERALSGTPTMAARIASIDVFETPPNGAGPVLYFAVESPGLRSLHDTLCESFEPAPEIEGADYVPHVTIARGGPMSDLDRRLNASFEAIEWTITELALYDARHEEVVTRYALPA